MGRKKDPKNLLMEKLLKKLESDPDFLEKLDDLVEDRPAEKAVASTPQEQKSEGPTSLVDRIPSTRKLSEEEVLALIQKDAAQGTLKMEQGNVLTGVHQGLCVCCLCGKEQKTWSNTPGKVTQNVCSVCHAKMSTMTEAERQSFWQVGIRQNHLKMAKAKFKAQQEVFRENMAEMEKQMKKTDFSVTGE